CATLCPPDGAVLAFEQALIFMHEGGAPGFFGRGLEIEPLAGIQSRIDPAALDHALTRTRGADERRPAALSLTNATEYGTVYSPDEVRTLTGIAKRRGWRVHMDGARFANALVHLGCHPADVTWRAGVDVLSFGAIKNGGMSAEALVFFDETLATELPYRRKRAGQMPSKGRFNAAQLIAYIESGAWQRNAQAANGAARRLADAAGARLTHAVEANEVFVDLGTNGPALRDRGFTFYDWGAAGSGEARFVVSWDQREDEIAALVAALRALD
ncbi:MAG: beta-eliminating lyase-related protein, partial [Sphingomonadaceae bacterium]|nr:beta-eliminating lyase-related protein [Sphingomonadaceae bacterium]